MMMETKVHVLGQADSEAIIISSLLHSLVLNLPDRYSTWQERNKCIVNVDANGPIHCYSSVNVLHSSAESTMTLLRTVQ